LNRIGNRPGLLGVGGGTVSDILDPNEEGFDGFRFFRNDQSFTPQIQKRQSKKKENYYPNCSDYFH